MAATPGLRRSIPGPAGRSAGHQFLADLEQSPKDDRLFAHTEADEDFQMQSWLAGLAVHDLSTFDGEKFRVKGIRAAACHFDEYTEMALFVKLRLWYNVGKQMELLDLCSSFVTARHPMLRHTVKSAHASPNTKLPNVSACMHKRMGKTFV